MFRARMLPLIGLLIGSSMMTGCAPKLESYFPLVANQAYTYTWTFNRQNGTDTLFCRTTSTQDIGQPFYYFVESDEELDFDPIVGTEIFGPGAYYYANGELYTAKVFWRADTEVLNATDFKLIFPRRVKPGYTNHFTLNSDGPKWTFEVMGFEEVVFVEKTYPKCLKVNITQQWPDRTNVQTIWLKKATGVVKWSRDTGRIDYWVEP